MPETQVIFYQDDRGRSEVVDWLRALRRSHPRAFAKCLGRIERLAELGHELRRPECDFLRDGIYELRSRAGNVNFRLLYFFHAQTAAIIAAGLTKEGTVPPAEIDRAAARKARFSTQPATHIFRDFL